MLRSAVVAGLVVTGWGLPDGRAIAEPPAPATFSIVAADPEAGEVGVAVASRFFAVGPRGPGPGRRPEPEAARAGEARRRPGRPPRPTPGIGRPTGRCGRRS